MLDFDPSLLSEASAPRFPEVGEVVGDFRLRAELGRGRLGRVFLAHQVSLADRPIVLKVIPCDGREHLTLARLQHTHIVPLYAAQDVLDRNLRILCMPYFGGVTLDRVLLELRDTPPGLRSGRHVLDVLDRAEAQAPIAGPAGGPVRQALARVSYVRVVCWIGACVAEALQYAHERELIHLDVKPSNVLLAADGQPMLLDFHLARGPIPSGGPIPEGSGGTPGYMPPEQVALMDAERQGRSVALPLDGRADIYSLGVLLFEALDGSIPMEFEASTARLRRRNPQVSAGLADLVARCLASRPRDRYPDAALLAADLRSHLADRPLRGVANRSPAERWRKWRRRRPQALARWGALTTVLATGLGLGFQVEQRIHEAGAALDEGRASLERQEYSEAIHSLKFGLTRLAHIPAATSLRRALGAHLQRAERGRDAEILHDLVEQVRRFHGVDTLPRDLIRSLEGRCRSAWEARGLLVAGEGGPLAPVDERRLRADLLDLAILWADLRVRLAPGPEVDEARRNALRVLAEAEALCGPNIVLAHERRRHAEALGATDEARAAALRASDLEPRTAWEHYALGRSLLASGELEAALAAFDRALDLEPQGLWYNVYRGLCAFRLRRHEEALGAFSACVALAPATAECFHNRAMALAALGRTEPALADYGRALRLNPDLVEARLNRGILLHQLHRDREAAADFQQALALGADPATVRPLLHRISASRATNPPGSPVEPDPGASAP